MKESNNLLYIFIHVPKTGGTTIKNIIYKNFNKDEIIELYQEENEFLFSIKEVERYIESIKKTNRNKIKVIIGHDAYYGIHELFPKKIPRYIVFLREPIQRLISEYNFQRTLLKRGNYEKLNLIISSNGKALSFKEFLDDKYNLNNFMTNFLFSKFKYYKNSGDEMNTNIDEIKINIAKKLLDKCYFVGLTENANDFNFIYALLEIEAIVPKQNVSDKFLKRITDRELLNFAKEKNMLDYIVYSYAKSLNKKFKKNNILYHLFYESLFRVSLKKKMVFYFRYLYQHLCNVFDLTIGEAVGESRKAFIVKKVNYFYSSVSKNIKKIRSN